MLQSGQPYSIVDYSGAVGSIYYSINDGITNPIVPLAPGCTPENAMTGAIGSNFAFPALKSDCFTLPLLAPGELERCDSSRRPVRDQFHSRRRQRNIFRQSWQKLADISIVKQTKITERFICEYSFDVFNLTNIPASTSRSTTLIRTWLSTNFPSPDPRRTHDHALASGCVTGATMFVRPHGLGRLRKDDRQRAGNSDVAQVAVLVSVLATRDGDPLPPSLPLPLFFMVAVQQAGFIARGMRFRALEGHGLRLNRRRRERSPSSRRSEELCLLHAAREMGTATSR